jgi:hypothetical protein
MAGFEQLTGMARDIRLATASEDFDLAGFNEAKTVDIIKNAFSAPLTAPKEMIAFKFVIGGGKLVRSRYNDDLRRWMSGALKELGFEEDSSAACTLDSQGYFKHQHDTGQNLKYLWVYPRVQLPEASEGDEGADDGNQENSPTQLILGASLGVFRNMVAQKVVSWRQKKRVVKILTQGMDGHARIEAKLCRGEQLDAAEQRVYDSNSGEDEKKLEWLQGQIKEMVDAGKLTATEKEELLIVLVANRDAVEAEAAMISTDMVRSISICICICI